MPNVKGMLLNRAELGQFFGRSLPTIDVWVRDGCPIHSKGDRGQSYEFNTADVAEWLIEQAVAKEVGKQHTVDIGQIRRRKMEAEAMMSELNYKKARGEFHLNTECISAGEEVSDVINTQLNELERAVPEIRSAPSTREGKRILQKALDQVRVELGAYAGRKAEANSGMDVEVHASTRPESKRVGG